MPCNRELTIQVDEGDDGKRLDVVIAARIPTCSRSYASALISAGEIRLEGKTAKPGHRVRTGQRIDAHIPEPKPISALPEPMALDVCYEDGDLIVINKPWGIVVHPAPGNYTGTLVNGILHHCPDLEGIGGEIRPGIVHRLDKDTSGLLVVAKTAAALDHLSRQFKERSVHKTYLAVVHGVPESSSGRIALPITRHPVDRKRMSAIDQATEGRAGKRRGKARRAETGWKRVQQFEGASLLQLTPTTGRTHQIRVHCSSIGHPIVGDTLYARSRRHPSSKLSKATRAHLASVKRQMLHAWRLVCMHPATGREMAFESPIPEDMAGLMAELATVQESRTQSPGEEIP